MYAGKLISCFPTFKEIQDKCLMNLRQKPQNNMPVFFLKPRKKQAKCFE